jgi:hypothetical protein
VVQARISQAQSDAFTVGTCIARRASCTHAPTTFHSSCFPRNQREGGLLLIEAFQVEILASCRGGEGGGGEGQGFDFCVASSFISENRRRL